MTKELITMMIGIVILKNCDSVKALILLFLYCNNVEDLLLWDLIEDPFSSLCAV